MTRKSVYDNTVDTAQEVQRTASASLDRASEPWRQGAQRGVQLCRRFVECTQQVQLAQLEALRSSSTLLLDAMTHMQRAASREVTAQASAETWQGLIQQARAVQDVMVGAYAELRGDMLRAMRDQADDLRESGQAIGRLSIGSAGTVVFDPLATMMQARESLDQWLARWNAPFSASATTQV